MYSSALKDLNYREGVTRGSRQLFYNELTLYTRAFEPRAKQPSRVGSKIYVRIKKLGIENH